MWSLKQGLTYVKPHLPSEFDARHGVRSLFPQGYSGSISPLKGYVFSAYARLGTLAYGVGNVKGIGSAANTYVMADGTGRWFFSWLWWPVMLQAANLRKTGFVFYYSNDGNARGFVDTSGPPPSTKSCNSGTDAWIAEHWPQIFAAGRYVLLEDIVARPNLKDAIPANESDVWTGAGFAESAFIQLDGSGATCAPTVSGSTLFPFPSYPTRLVSPVGVFLSFALGVAGQALERCLSTIPKTFVSKSGLSFTATVPPGLKPGGSGHVGVSFSSTDKKTKGTYNWSFPSGKLTATGETAFSRADGTYTIDYTYSSDIANAQCSLGQLDYTVSFAGTDKSKSSVTQTVVNALVTSQTSSSSGPSGVASTATLTVNPDGTLDVSSSNPNAAATIAVPTSAAQRVSLVNLLLAPAGALTWELLDLAPTGPDRIVVTEGSPVGPLTYTITVQPGTNGTVYTATVSSQVGADVSVIGAMTVDGVTGVTGSTIRFDGTAEGDATWSLVYSVSTGPSGIVIETVTVGYSDAAGDTSLTQTVINGSITGETSSFTDPDNNSSTAKVTVNDDGSSTLVITTVDANRNGTAETIQVDAAGNTTSDTTDPVGTGGSSWGGSEGEGESESESESESEGEGE